MQHFFTIFLKYVLPLILLLVLFLALRSFRQVAFTPEALLESTAVLRNPYQGFYRIVPYTLNEDGVADHASAG